MGIAALNPCYAADGISWMDGNLVCAVRPGSCMGIGLGVVWRTV